MTKGPPRLGTYLNVNSTITMQAEFASKVHIFLETATIGLHQAQRTCRPLGEQHSSSPGPLYNLVTYTKDHIQTARLHKAKQLLLREM